MRTFAAVVIVVALTAACERREEPKQAEYVAPARTPEPEPVTEALEPSMPADEVDVEFVTARENFVQRDFNRTAEDLKGAAERVTAMGESAAGKSRDELKGIARDISRIAKDVKNGTLKDVKKFDTELAGVEQSLAKHHLRAARDAMGKRDLRGAGRELNAAARDVHGMGERMGKDLDADTKQGVRYALTVGGKLTEGVEQAPADFENAVKGLERGVDRLAHEIRPHK
jgi:hypothetical protein